MNKVYQVIASLQAARDNCNASGNGEWSDKHSVRLSAIIREHMPSGAGIDNGTKLSEDSTPERLVFTFGYHHMNDVGMYDGWTEHKCIVTASLVTGITLRITGRDRNGLKDYLYDTFHQALTADTEE